MRLPRVGCHCTSDGGRSSLCLAGGGTEGGVLLARLPGDTGDAGLPSSRHAVPGRLHVCSAPWPLGEA